MAEDSFPYVRFEIAQVEDRQKTIESGFYQSRDVEYAHITRAGQRDTLVKDATVYLANLREAAQQGRIPQNWPATYQTLYKAWKEGLEPPTNGTPILGWMAIPSAAQKMLIQAGIRSVEDLASLAEGDMHSIGMGAVSYRQKAVAWLETASGVGKTAERLASLETSNQEAQRIIAEQADALKRLTAQLDVLTPKTPAKV